MDSKNSALIIYNLYSVIIRKTLKNRAEYYKYITKYLQHNKCKIIKQIGTQSKTGAIFMCSGEKSAEILKFACKKYKIISKSIYNDINLSIRLSALVLKDVNPHFNIVYRYQYHNNHMLIELAQGDLKNFLSKCKSR